MKNDYLNKKFGRITIKTFNRRTSKSLYFNCLCDCGNWKIIRGDHLKSGSTQSCGCLINEIRHSPKANGKDSKTWKENPGYRAIHIWIRKVKGLPKKCSLCKKSTGKIEWANVDHKYQRNINDYIELCTSCHRRFDIRYNGYLVKGKKPLSGGKIGEHQKVWLEALQGKKVSATVAKGFTEAKVVIDALLSKEVKGETV